MRYIKTMKPTPCKYRGIAVARALYKGDLALARAHADNFTWWNTIEVWAILAAANHRFGDQGRAIGLTVMGWERYL